MKLLRLLISGGLLALCISGCTTTVVTPRPGYYNGYYGPAHPHCWYNSNGVQHCN